MPGDSQFSFEVVSTSSFAPSSGLGKEKSASLMSHDQTGAILRRRAILEFCRSLTPLPHDSRRRLFQTNAVAATATAAARTDNRRVNAAAASAPSVCLSVWAVGIKRASRSRPRDENLVRENSCWEGGKEGRRIGRRRKARGRSVGRGQLTTDHPFLVPSQYLPPPEPLHCWRRA